MQKADRDPAVSAGTVTSAVQNWKKALTVVSKGVNSKLWPSLVK